MNVHHEMFTTSSSTNSRSFESTASKCDRQDGDEHVLSRNMMRWEPTGSNVDLQGPAIATNTAITMGQDYHHAPLFSTTQLYNEGRWTFEEKILFLKGLRRYGRGKWKKIGSLLPTRSALQVKSHGQKVLSKLQAGENVLDTLHQAEAMGIIPPSPHNRQHSDICRFCHDPRRLLLLDDDDDDMKDDDSHSIMTCASDPLPQRRRPPAIRAYATPPASVLGHDGDDGRNHHSYDFQQDNETRNDVYHSTESTTTCSREAPGQTEELTLPDMEKSRDDLEKDIALFLCRLSSSSSSRDWPS